MRLFPWELLRLRWAHTSEKQLREEVGRSPDTWSPFLSESTMRERLWEEGRHGRGEKRQGDGRWDRQVERHRMLGRGSPTEQACSSLWFLLCTRLGASRVSVQFSHSLVSNSLWPHVLQHARPPCPSSSPRVYSNSCPLSQWYSPKADTVQTTVAVEDHIGAYVGSTYQNTMQLDGAPKEWFKVRYPSSIWRNPWILIKSQAFCEYSRRILWETWMNSYLLNDSKCP